MEQTQTKARIGGCGKINMQTLNSHNVTMSEIMEAHGLARGLLQICELPDELPP